VAALLAIVVALILYVTLSPFEFHFAHRHTSVLVHLLHSWPARIDRGVIRDAILNIALFIPLGLTGYLTFARYWSRSAALTFAVTHGLLLSLCIEVLQYYDATRFSSLADCAFNTLGAFCGALVAVLFQQRLEAVASAAGRRGAGAGILLAGLWMAAQLYPLLPQFKLARLSANWGRLLATRIDWVEVIAGAIGWFVFALALRTIWGKLPWAWLALCMFAVPLRLVIWDRVTSKSDLAGAILGLILWVALPDSMRAGAAWLMLPVAIAIRELAPFHLGAAHAFSWRPFGATMAHEHAVGVAIILRKAFEYGAMVWLLHAGKMRYRTAGLLVAAALFAMEFAQTRMPGREPEITDPLLALIMALLLRFVG
jgi:glycopeptide antibiotics resistance protein